MVTFPVFPEIPAQAKDGHGYERRFDIVIRIGTESGQRLDLIIRVFFYVCIIKLMMFCQYFPEPGIGAEIF